MYQAYDGRGFYPSADAQAQGPKTIVMPANQTSPSFIPSGTVQLVNAIDQNGRPVTLALNVNGSHNIVSGAQPITNPSNQPRLDARNFVQSSGLSLPISAPIQAPRQMPVLVSQGQRLVQFQPQQLDTPVNGYHQPVQSQPGNIASLKPLSGVQSRGLPPAQSAGLPMALQLPGGLQQVNGNVITSRPAVASQLGAQSFRRVGQPPVVPGQPAAGLPVNRQILQVPLQNAVSPVNMSAALNTGPPGAPNVVYSTAGHAAPPMLQTNTQRAGMTSAPIAIRPDQLQLLQQLKRGGAINSPQQLQQFLQRHVVQQQQQQQKQLQLSGVRLQNDAGSPTFGAPGQVGMSGVGHAASAAPRPMIDLGQLSGHSTSERAEPNAMLAQLLASVQSHQNQPRQSVGSHSSRGPSPALPASSPLTQANLASLHPGLGVGQERRMSGLSMNSANQGQEASRAALPSEDLRRRSNLNSLSVASLQNIKQAPFEVAHGQGVGSHDNLHHLLHLNHLNNAQKRASADARLGLGMPPTAGNAEQDLSHTLLRIAQDQERQKSASASAQSLQGVLNNRMVQPAPSPTPEDAAQMSQQGVAMRRDSKGAPVGMSAPPATTEGGGKDDVNRLLVCIAKELARQGITLEKAISYDWVGGLSPTEAQLLRDVYMETRQEILQQQQVQQQQLLESLRNLQNQAWQRDAAGGAVGAPEMDGGAFGGNVGLAAPDAEVPAAEVKLEDGEQPVEDKAKRPSEIAVEKAIGLEHAKPEEFSAFGYGFFNEKAPSVDALEALEDDAGREQSLEQDGKWLEEVDVELEKRPEVGDGLQDQAQEEHWNSPPGPHDHELAARFANLDLGCGFF